MLERSLTMDLSWTSFLIVDRWRLVRYGHLCWALLPGDRVGALAASKPQHDVHSSVGLAGAAHFCARRNVRKASRCRCNHLRLLLFRLFRFAALAPLSFCHGVLLG